MPLRSGGASVEGDYSGTAEEGRHDELRRPSEVWARFRHRPTEGVDRNGEIDACGPPEAAIVGINKMQVRPVWRDSGFVPRTMMNLSSSFDHRIIDSWEAARSVQRVKALLEEPAMLFIAPPLPNT